MKTIKSAGDGGMMPLVPVYRKGNDANLARVVVDPKVREYMERNSTLENHGDRSYVVNIKVNLEDPIFSGTKRERMAQWAVLFEMDPDEFIAEHEGEGA